MASEREVSAHGGAGTAVSPTLQGVSRALRVLDFVAERPMRTSELAEELGISWATLQRTLAQLEADGFVYRDGGGLFHIGRKTWLLGSTYLVGHRLLEMAVPFFNREATGQTPSVLQLVERSGGSSVVLLAREASTSEVITRTTYGHHFPLHCGSKGHVLLAYADQEFIDDYLSHRLLALTPQTITDPDQLRASLAEVRAQGFAVTIGDVQTFTGSVAAPIYDADGGVEACVTAVMTRSQMTEPRVEETVDAVLRIAQALSLGLGWKPLQHARANQDA